MGVHKKMKLKILGQKIFKKLLIVLFLIISIYGFSYIFSKHSQPFMTATLFIRSSEIIKNELGNVSKVDLYPFGYNIEFAGKTGSADFECDVSGSVRQGKVYVTLENGINGWHVVNANLEIGSNHVSLMN